MNDSLEAGSVSKSRTRRRDRIIHPSVLSTTHRLGSTTEPLMSSLRLTISRVSWSFTRAVRFGKDVSGVFGFSRH
jgi:hypothetical protein